MQQRLSQKQILALVSADLLYHLCGTAIFAVLVYVVSRSVLYVALVFLGGILIDLDHCLDYFLFFKREFRLKHFFLSSYLCSGKVYIVLHSWELVFSLGITGLILNSFGVFICALSMAMHLVIDTVQRENRLMYFLSYRFLKRFSVNSIVPEFKRYPLTSSSSLRKNT